MKEDLPVAARALKLTIQPWVISSADDFEKVFAALNKQRPDGLYVSAGPLMIINQKQIAGFALKSRLLSIYDSRVRVEVGGLMSYGADLAESYRPRRILRGQNPEGR